MTLLRFAQALFHGITLSFRAEQRRATEPRVLLLHGFREVVFIWGEAMNLLAGASHCVVHGQPEHVAATIGQLMVRPRRTAL